MLTGGLALRIVDGQYAVLGGTFVAAAGIADEQRSHPGRREELLPHAIGRVTGIYTAALSAGGGIGAFTPALEPFVGGWRGALGAWAALSAAALIVWLFGARHGSHDAIPVTHERPRRSMLRSPLAWVITVFFGMQACFAYILMGWLAEFFVAHGIARTEAGLMLAFINLIGIPLSFVIPVYALNRPSQSGWVIALACFSLAGVAGLVVAPAAAPWLWTVLLGIGMSMFPIAIGVIALRTRETSETTVLSAMVQGVRIPDRRLRPVHVRDAALRHWELDGAACAAWRCDHRRRCTGIFGGAPTFRLTRSQIGEPTGPSESSTKTRTWPMTFA